MSVCKRARLQSFAGILKGVFQHGNGRFSLHLAWMRAPATSSFKQQACRAKCRTQLGILSGEVWILSLLWAFFGLRSAVGRQAQA